MAILLLAQESGLARAWSLVKAGNNSAAIDVLGDYIKTNPSDADAELLLGTLLKQGGSRDAALGHLSAAVRLRPDSFEAQATLGEAYLAFNDPQAARVPLEQAVLINPKSGTAQLELGRVLLEARDYPSAADHLDLALSYLGHDSDAATAHYLRAKVYSERADATRAATDLEKAVALRDNFPEAWSDLGEARKLLGQHSTAVAAFRKAVALAPNDSVAQYRLGEEYLTQRQPHLAVEPLSQAHRLSPQDHSILNALQKALRQDGRDKEADEVKQQLAALLAQDEADTQVDMKAVKLNNEGAQLQKAGDLQGAVEKYAAASRLEPKNVPIRVNYAVAMLRLGNWTDGLNELHQSLLLDPNNSKIRAALRDALSQAPPGAAPEWKNEFK
jgi:tetratricopeptide (TPR) repeat protein